MVQRWETPLKQALEEPQVADAPDSRNAGRDRLLRTLPSFLVVVSKASVLEKVAESSAGAGAGVGASATQAKAAALAALQTWAGRVTQHLLVNLESLGSEAASPIPNAEMDDNRDAAAPPAASPAPNAFGDAAAAGGLAALTKMLAQGADVSVVMQPGQDPAQFLRQQLIPALEALAAPPGGSRDDGEQENEEEEE